MQKVGLKSGTVSNYPVGLFLTLDLLLAAVGMIFFFFCGTVPGHRKGKKVVPKLTLRHIQGVALRIDPKFDCWVYFALQKYSVFAGFERKKTQK